MVSALSRVYIDNANATGDSSFFVSAGYGKGGVASRTTHLTSHKYDCWIDGGSFVLYTSRYYTAMSHSKQDRSSFSLSLSWYDCSSIYGDGRGDVGPIALGHPISCPFDRSNFSRNQFPLERRNPSVPLRRRHQKSWSERGYPMVAPHHCQSLCTVPTKYNERGRKLLRGSVINTEQ